MLSLAPDVITSITSFLYADDVMRLLMCGTRRLGALIARNTRSVVQRSGGFIRLPLSVFKFSGLRSFALEASTPGSLVPLQYDGERFNIPGGNQRLLSLKIECLWSFDLLHDGGAELALDFPSLTSLSLEGCSKSGNPRMVIALSDKLTKLTLQSISYSSVLASAVSLPMIGRRCPNLSHLELVDIMADPRSLENGEEILAEMKTSFPALETLFTNCLRPETLDILLNNLPDQLQIVRCSPFHNFFGQTKFSNIHVKLLPRTLKELDLLTTSTATLHIENSDSWPPTLTVFRPGDLNPPKTADLPRSLSFDPTYTFKYIHKIEPGHYEPLNNRLKEVALDFSKITNADEISAKFAELFPELESLYVSSFATSKIESLPKKLKYIHAPINEPHLWRQLPPKLTKLVFPFGLLLGASFDLSLLPPTLIHLDIPNWDVDLSLAKGWEAFSRLNFLSKLRLSRISLHPLDTTLGSYFPTSITELSMSLEDSSPKPQYWISNLLRLDNLKVISLKLGHIQLVPIIQSIPRGVESLCLNLTSGFEKESFSFLPMGLRALDLRIPNKSESLEQPITLPDECFENMPPKLETFYGNFLHAHPTPAIWKLLPRAISLTTSTPNGAVRAGMTAYYSRPEWRGWNASKYR